MHYVQIIVKANDILTILKKVSPGNEKMALQ